VRAGHDDDIVDRARAHGLEDARKERLLLRRLGAVPRRRAGGEDDRLDQEQPANAAQRASTLAT
jgi:hypothetical protein